MSSVTGRERRRTISNLISYYRTTGRLLVGELFQLLILHSQICRGSTQLSIRIKQTKIQPKPASLAGVIALTLHLLITMTGYCRINDLIAALDHLFACQSCLIRQTL